MTLVLLVGGPHSGELRDVLPSALKQDNASIPIFGDRPADRSPSPLLGRYRLDPAHQTVAEWEPSA